MKKAKVPCYLTKIFRKIQGKNPNILFALRKSVDMAKNMYGGSKKICNLLQNRHRGTALLQIKLKQLEMIWKKI